MSYKNGYGEKLYRQNEIVKIRGFLCEIRSFKFKAFMSDGPKK